MTLLRTSHGNSLIITDTRAVNATVNGTNTLLFQKYTFIRLMEI